MKKGIDKYLVVEMEQGKQAENVRWPLEYTTLAPVRSLNPETRIRNLKNDILSH